MSRGYWKKDDMAEKEDEGSKFVPKETLKDIELYPFVDIPQRGIRKETCEKFGVRGYVNNGELEALYFPSYNQKGKLTGYSKQDITKDKSEKYHWTTIGVVNIANKMFGQDVAEANKRKRTSLIQTEGQHDAMACYQAMRDQVKGTKYADLEPFVVSIPLGTANAVESNLHNHEFIASYESLCLFYDDDYCTPAEKAKGIMKGHEARHAVAGALIGSGLSLFTVTTPDDHKDASDMLQAGQSDELAKLVQFGKRAYSAEKIIHAGDISFEDLITARKEGVYVKCFPKLMQKIRGLRKRELVLLTSPSGVGKSTICNLIANDLMAEGDRVGMIFLEETTKESVQRMVAGKLKVNYNKFKNAPLECAERDAIKEAYDDIVENDRLVLLDHFGSMPITELMSKIKTMHLVEKCDWIILDHLSMVISGSAVSDERKELDMVMTELAAFCAANEIGIIAVSHLNRSVAADFKPEKGKEDQPFWVRVTKEQMRGSAALEQLSWIILGLEPQIMPTRERGNVRITVLKNRPWNTLGEADEFFLDEDTWEVLLVD